MTTHIGGAGLASSKQLNLFGTDDTSVSTEKPSELAEPVESGFFTKLAKNWGRLDRVAPFVGANIALPPGYKERLDSLNGWGLD